MNDHVMNTLPAEWDPAQARMSFFTKPVYNRRPSGELSLFQVYQYVRSRQAMPETQMLRSMTDHDQARAYKTANFDFITPSGTFSYCADSCLVRHSGLLCMDLDGLGERVEELFERLLADPAFTTLLLFRSPSGAGLKWFVHIDVARCDHRVWFQAVRRYLMHTYQLGEKQVDPLCANLSRGCFLGHDPEAYLPVSLIEYF